MLDWIRSLFAKPPLPEPWPSREDFVAAVDQSLRERPGDWYLTTDFMEWRALQHRNSRVSVYPGGQINYRGQYAAKSEVVPSLFWLHAEVVANVAAAREEDARYWHRAIQSLKPKEIHCD